MSRLPGTCKGCGARVELATGLVEVVTTPYRPCEAIEKPAPIFWAEPDSNVPHSCTEHTFGLDCREYNVPGAARTAPAPANPAATGVSNGG